MNQPTGRELTEKGIAESHEHAEGVSPEWSLRAIKLVEEYARYNETFMTEEAKVWAYQNGLPEPPVDGAWGHVMRAAAARGIIHRAGKREAKSPGQHGKLMTLWRRGSEMMQRSAPTAKAAHEMADSLKRFSEQMKKEGRTIFAERLLEAERMIRDLAA